MYIYIYSASNLIKKRFGCDNRRNNHSFVFCFGWRLTIKFVLSSVVFIFHVETSGLA